MKNFKLFLLLLMIFSSNIILAQKDSIASQRKARELLRDGNKLYNQEKYNDASVAYRKALGETSDYDKADFNLGNAFYQDKNYKEAVAQFELSAKTAKDKFAKAEAYHNIGNAMMEQKQYQPAIDAYKNALRNNPNDDETRYNLAVAQKLLDKENQDKNKDKDKENKDDQNKDDKDKDKKDGDDKDKKDNKDKKDQEKDGDKDKKDPKKDEKDKNQKPKPKPGQMTPQQVKQLLESLNNEEKKTQEKLNAKKAKGKKVKQEKDW